MSTVASEVVEGEEVDTPWQFQPGNEVGKAGTPNAGKAVKWWCNHLQGKTREELTAILEDDRTPITKVQAVRLMLAAGSNEKTAAGAYAASPELRTLLDYTDGKPVQNLSVTVQGEVRLTAQSLSILAIDPAVLDASRLLAERVTQALPAPDDDAKER